MARRGLTRQRVIDAATDYTAIYGYSQLTINNLANYLEIKPASLYNHIAGLEDLKLHVGLTVFSRLFAQTKNATCHKTGFDAIRAFARSYRAFFLENPELFEPCIESASSANQSVDKARLLIDNEYNRLFENCGMSWQQTVHFRRLLKSILFGFISQEIVQGRVRPLVWKDESFDLAIEVLLAGVEKEVSSDRS